MFFNDLKCEKCGNFTLMANFEDTLDSYLENEFNMDHMLILLNESPPARPGYIVFSCSYEGCGNKIKLTEKEILEKLLEDWAYIAWTMAKYYINHTHQFEEYRTRYLYDDRINKFIKGNGEMGPYLDTAEVFKDFSKFVQDEKKKHIK